MDAHTLRSGTAKAWGYALVLVQVIVKARKYGISKASAM